jgi:hypothetical protein
MSRLNQYLAAGLLAMTLLMMTASDARAAGKPSMMYRYWRDFKEYWLGSFENQGSIVLVTLLVGALAIFIITRGKWKK